MAFGFTPKFVQVVPITGIPVAHFLVLAAEAAQKMEMVVQYISDNGLIAIPSSTFGKQQNELRITIKEGNATIQSETTSQGMVDWGKNKKIVTELVATIEELRANATAEQLDEIYAELKPNFPASEEDILVMPPTSLWSLFVPRKGFWITPVLIDINIIVFIVMACCGVNILDPSGEALIKWGANFKPYTLDGGWWRLITCCFLHIGIIHLLMNMYALLYIGILLEPRLGGGKFLAAYLLTGITSSMTSLWWHDSTISAGASGAIFGMYGVFLAMLTTNLIEKDERKAQLTSIGIFVIYNLIYGLKGGVDNAAHIGGLFGGLFIGYIFYPGLKQGASKGLQASLTLGAAVVIIGASFFLFKKVPNTIGRYDQMMERFSVNETKSLSTFKIIDSLPAEQSLPYLDTSVTKWEQNKQIMDSILAFDLPKELKGRAKKLNYYTIERLAHFQLLRMALKENTNKYDEELTLHGNHIDSIIKLLNGK